MASFDEDEEGELTVFQCSTCKIILANTSQSDGASAELGIVCFEEVPDTVTIASKSRTSRDEEDIGCVYSILSCLSCKTAVGKYYKKPTEELSELQDHACLLLDKLKFYTVALRNSMMNRSTSQENSHHDILAELKNNIHKIQFVMCSFDERIGRIEQLLKLPELAAQNEKGFLEPTQQDKSNHNSSTRENYSWKKDSNRSGDQSTYQRSWELNDDSDRENRPKRQLSPRKSQNSLKTQKKRSAKLSMRKSQKERLSKRKNVEKDEGLAEKKQRTNLK